jgi:DNA (cytosine-5)-methyltransferase 1
VIKLVELFGGIGAVRKALERENIEFESVGYVEIDKNACKSYNALYNESYTPMSVCDYHLPEEQIDLLVHGSPCTQFSIVGLRTGGVEGSGTESSLMWETVRAIREAKYKPKIVLWENVENTLNYPEYNQYINALNELGYISTHKVLNSLDFGIPQTRNRVFTVSILNGSAFNFDNLQTTPMVNIDKFIDRNFYSDKYRVADRTLAIQFGKLPNNPFNGRNMFVGDYARTIVSNYAKVPTSNILAVGDKYRHITEKESWLLLGFDESDYEKAQALYPQRYIGGKECMCGILYRQAGNSIVVPVLQAILRELKQYF